MGMSAISSAQGKSVTQIMSIEGCEKLNQAYETLEKGFQKELTRLYATNDTLALKKDEVKDKMQLSQEIEKLQVSIAKKELLVAEKKNMLQDEKMSSIKILGIFSIVAAGVFGGGVSCMKIATKIPEPFREWLIISIASTTPCAIGSLGFFAESKLKEFFVSDENKKIRVSNANLSNEIGELQKNIDDEKNILNEKMQQFINM